jgi:hypothetical protein
MFEVLMFFIFFYVPNIIFVDEFKILIPNLNLPPEILILQSENI